MQIALQQHAVMQIPALQRKMRLTALMFSARWNAGHIQWTAAREDVFVRITGVLLRLVVK
jgi:hypothetical protein